MTGKYKVFAAIEVGSYETCIKVFEMSARNNLKELDYVRHHLDLGSQTYKDGKLTGSTVDELCRVLLEFRDIMKSYGVEDYRVYGTSAIRDMENKAIVFDQIRMRTGINIEVLSNSEQRFLHYKSVASRAEVFNGLISGQTAIIDIGGGSIQVSFFEKDSLTATQNLRIGILKMRENLFTLNCKVSEYEDIIHDLATAQFSFLEKLYLKGRKLDNIIVMDEYISNAMGLSDMTMPKRAVDWNEYTAVMGDVLHMHMSMVAKKYNLDEDNALLLYISAIIVDRFKSIMGGDKIWVPDVGLCDGMAYEYGERQKLFPESHDFEKDIIDCTLNISKRYMGSKKRGETLENIALTIFDAMKKVHGLSERERLLLRLAALLHDCGKYITLSDVGEASFQIVLATEIIGLSHKEREIVAFTVRYNYRDFEYYESGVYRDLDRSDYLVVAKLAAILMIATGLDRSHKGKFKKLKARMKERELILTPEGDSNIIIEKGLLSSRTNFFKEIYDITPVIKRKGGV